MSIKEQKIFVVYFHTNSFTGEIFYVGIGKESRPRSRVGRSSIWKYYVKKYGYEVRVVHAGLNWYDACEMEKEYIKKFGRRDIGTGVLLNMTEGGDGGVGQVGPWKGKKRPELGELNRKRTPSTKGKKGLYHHSGEVKKKLSERAKGRKAWNKGMKGLQKMPPSFFEKRKTYLTGRKHSEETRKKMSEAAKGRKKSPEHIEKVRVANIGRKASQSTREKLSKVFSHRWTDADYKEKMSAILKERWKDPEYKRKVIESRKKTCRTKNAA